MEAEPTVPPTGEHAAPAERDRIGATIASYVIRAKLGQGGMGTVYLAEHTSLGRRVAIKVLLPGLSHSREVITRLFNEARTASSVRHPSIVEIYDFGCTAEGDAYIVMEYLDGESLGARHDRMGRFEPKQTLALARQIANGLAAAHELGIIHRDLKPENVIIVSDPEVQGGKRIKLLDFGIAKLEHGDGQSLTLTGTMLGTPTYMSPEQCRGAGVVDARADFYALGCMMYELLLGTPPFTGESPGDLIAQHLYFDPVPLSKRDPSVPPAVDELVLWLLRKDPAARPQTANELIAAIDRIELPDQPAAAAPAPAPTPAPPPASLTSAATVPLIATPTTLSNASGGTTRKAAAQHRWILPVGVGGMLVAGLVTFLVLRSGSSETPPPPTPTAQKVWPEAGARKRIRERPTETTTATSAESFTENATTTNAPTPPTTAEPTPTTTLPTTPPPTTTAATTTPTTPPTAAPATDATVVKPVTPGSELSAPKPPPRIKVTVDSDPVGANVVVDGKPIGTTPFTEDVEASTTATRIYSIEKDGYESGTLKLATDRDASEKIILKKKKRRTGVGDRGVNPFDQ